GNNATTDLVGTYDLSNSIKVYRNAPNAGEIVGGPYNFTVDGTADYVTNIGLEGPAEGSNSTWVITDESGKILGLPPTLEAVKGVNFDAAGAGTCLIWYLRYEDGLVGAEVDKNANDLYGCFDLSNSITVVRTAAVVDGGTISGGPFTFCVGDGEADYAKGVSLECNSTVNSQWVVTDENGKILGLPPTPEAVNFDGAGAGLCLIWHLSYADGLEGLEAGNNATTDLVGTYDLSNSIKVYRNAPNAGEIVGGPYNFTVDGTADYVTNIGLEGPAEGSNSTWVITDESGKILGLPPTLEAVKGVNFDAAGAGTCLIWYLRYEDGLVGAEVDKNANDLYGCFDLSNSITVVR
ncbi:hypothetical protein, partial [uncultured Maribacter sp.]|uniref:hypothetical protein n=1 Tax=uncultured Maribacter sp. TaxID=431308 RepID=UPI00263779F2